MATPRYLLPGEVPRVDVQRHWAVLLNPGARGGGILTLLLFLWLNTGNSTLAGMLTVAMLAILAWFGWKLAEWRHDHFVVTDKRVLLVTGLLTKRIGMMPLLKVTDMTYERSWLGRRLSYGAFVLESAGQDQALHRIDFVPQPEEVSQTMFTLLFGAPGGAALPNERDPHPDPSGTYADADDDDTDAHPVAPDENLTGRAPDGDYPTDPNLPVVDDDPEPSNIKVIRRDPRSLRRP